MDNFLIRALLGAVGIALVAGPMGCFVAWRRMAYFGDTLSHGALLGVALGLALGWESTLGVILVCILTALGLASLQGRKYLAADTFLGIVSHGSLALGIVIVSFFEGVRTDLLAYLFGDILAVTPADLAWIWGGGALVLAGLVYLWRPLLAATVHEELARVEGVAVDRARVGFLLLVALVVAVAMKIVGILPIAALLIVPAATARRFAATPEAMAVGAAIFGIFAAVAGLGGSYFWNTPAGPSVVVASVILFALTTALKFERA